jgi:hypothetical protein
MDCICFVILSIYYLNCEFMMNVIAVVLCIALWVPVHIGLWLHEVRHMRKAVSLLRAYGVCATALGIFIGSYWYPNEFLLFGAPSRWYLAFLSGAGLLFLVAVLVRLTPRREFQRFDTVLNLAHYLVVVGLFEEVWFRGIWFAVFGGSFVNAVVVGSIAFGLVHYSPVLRPRDIQSVVWSIFAGSVFAAARYAGAGIVPLAVAHGAFDFLFHYVYRQEAPRYGPRTTGAVFIVACLLLVVSIVLLGR